MELSVPGKTFLVGEYLALSGGPSILLTTAPLFRLHVVRGAVSPSVATGLDPESVAEIQSFTGFHPLSPAGKYLARHVQWAQQFSFSFDDPHLGRGGLGASSAQFALLYALRNEITRVDTKAISWSRLLEDYRDVAWHGEGVPPSGADVVAQLSGGVIWWDGRALEAKHLEWCFPNLVFTLVRTGAKLATHEHLKQKKEIPHEKLQNLVARATEAFARSDESLLIQAVQEYGITLAEAGLVAEGTQNLLSRWRERCSAIVAAKGCGAMGADVILLLHAANVSREVEELAREWGLEVCGRFADLAPGLQVKEEV